jgi:hypothetical protein
MVADVPYHLTSSNRLTGDDTTQPSTARLAAMRLPPEG